uniref:WS_DGAT_C domain-containing protein n=1 Tax=Loa loa TaxID=7209 RepID=A0A1I7W532_LOALO
MRQEEKLQVKYIHDRRDAYKLKTPQVHVLIQPTHSTVLPGFIKFMASIKKMNVSDVAKFVMLSIEIEKYIISPNIDKVLCFPNQQVILMNTVLGNYHSFTIYVANLDESKNVKNLTDEMSGNVGLTRMIAKELLNPVRCDLMFFGVISNDV